MQNFKTILWGALSLFVIAVVYPLIIVGACKWFMLLWKFIP